ncbi:hypothetical protein A3765_20605 [Oleiphilus sp. HI0130]|nr:hypothetical protein A3765_20605 [Oleiphilus sp. HI0130]
MGHFQSRIRRKLITKIAGFVLSKADAIKQLYDGQLKNFSANIKTPNIHTFFDYSDADRFKNLGENKEILFVGHPFHIKGIDILIEAFDAISGKNNNWHLKILGWHTGADLDYIKSACTKNKQISYHPPVRAREMVTHIGSCGILALPSRTEAMGRVLIEAMAAEKPRIASNVDGIPSVIKDNEDGLLFEAENSHQLASKLDLLISDNALRARLAKNGYNRYTSAFKLKHYIEHCKKLFNSTLN